MIITSTTTSISFFPMTDIDGEVNVQMWVKNTKKMVEDTDTASISGTMVTLSLPIFTSLNLKELDQVLIRVMDGDVLLWEYLGIYTNNTTDLNTQFKSFTTTANTQPEWLTI
jgi:hypothetical protein